MAKDAAGVCTEIIGGEAAMSVKKKSCYAAALPLRSQPSELVPRLTSAVSVISKHDVIVSCGEPGANQAPSFLVMYEHVV